MPGTVVSTFCGSFYSILYKYSIEPHGVVISVKSKWLNMDNFTCLCPIRALGLMIVILIVQMKNLRLGRVSNLTTVSETCASQTVLCKPITGDLVKVQILTWSESAFSKFPGDSCWSVDRRL